jgi:serine/threonine-protein kinase HipA
MTIEIIHVFYGDDLIGRLAEYQGGHLWEYDRDFLRRGIELSPLRLPTSTQSKHCLNPALFRLPGMIWDTLPDSFGMKIMDNAFASQNISSPTALQRLAYVGRDGIGALRFEPLLEDAAAKVIGLAKFAQAAKEIDSRSDRTQLKLLRHSTSVGGARPKALISFDPRTNDYLVGAEPLSEREHWLVKFQSSSDDEETITEHALSLLAKKCGIHTVQTTLLKENFQSHTLHHFAAQRFDIENGRKIHYHSYKGLMEEAYGNRPSPDYENLIVLTAKLTGSHWERVEMFRRALFNVFICNNDDHAKNHGFLFDGLNWRLSPAFDLTFSLHSFHTERAMPVLGKIHHIGQSQFKHLAKVSGISSKEASATVEEVREGLKHWMSLADKVGLTSSMAAEIETAITLKLGEYDSMG